MKATDKISNQNGEWYIVEIIMKCEPVIRNEKKELRRVTTWGNYHLIKAKTIENAYEKAVKIGKKSEFKFVNSDKLAMEWIFVGIGDLLPIYEKNIEDGTEIMWTNYGFISNKKAERFARNKKEIIKNLNSKQKNQ